MNAMKKNAALFGAAYSGEVSSLLDDVAALVKNMSSN